MTPAPAGTSPLVRCIDCAYLSKRAVLQGNWRAHEGFHELEPRERETPAEGFRFVPGETNSLHGGEYACFRHAAAFGVEFGAAVADGAVPSRDKAADFVLKRLRECARWSQYAPGTGPSQAFEEQREGALEADRRRFETTLAEFQARLGEQEGRQNKRLAVAAILVTLVLGVIQLWVAGMSMLPESIGIAFGRWVKSVTDRIAHLF